MEHTTAGKRVPGIKIKDSLTTFGKRVVFVPIYNGRGLKGEPAGSAADAGFWAGEVLPVE